MLEHRDPQRPRAVLVIGGGAAGLYAAQLLQQAGAQVTLLEAGPQLGGRVRALRGFAPDPSDSIELGAEELHGQRSLGHQLARERGLHLRSRGDRLRLFCDLAAGRRQPPAAADPDLQVARRFFDALPRYQGPDHTLSQALAALPPRARAYLDVVLGNEYGASSERLGMHGLARAESAWETQGARNFLLLVPLLDLLLPPAAPQAPPLTLLCRRVVSAIDWRGPQVQVDTRGGERFSADQALVTVPLPVLRDGDITFTPPLPPAQLAAARGIGIGVTLKIFLRFREPLWTPRKTSLTILGAPHAPELWTSGLRDSDPGAAVDRVLTALVSGRPAEALLALGSRLWPALLADLDVALGPRRRASQLLAEHHIQDWSAEPFVRGGYSYPTPGSVPLRAALAQPLQHPDEAAPRVAFAGEATHERLFGSLQGALLSARRAVAELAAAPP